jgi:cytochrome c oxidase assembly protein subunit 15
MTTDPQESAARLRILFARMALAAAALTFVVIVASAFMRHTQAGLACVDWPACYGRIEVSGGDALPPTTVRVARVAHRLAATSVLALVIGLLLVAWTQKPAWRREGGLALAALLVAAALAVLGLATPGSKIPAVTLGNLLGGYVMLALLAATAASGQGCDDTPLPATSGANSRTLAGAVLVLVFIHAASGGMIGAQYALTACPALGGCPAYSFGDLLGAGALDPFRALSIVGGHVVPPRNVAGLHVIHRVLGIAVVIATFALAHRMRRIDRHHALLLATLAGVAPLLGTAAIAGMPSLPMTVLHNAAAASLVAALAYLTARKVTE